MESLTSCPACRSAAIRFDYYGLGRPGAGPGEWRLDRCEACKHGFLNPRPSWEEQAPYYERNYACYQPGNGTDQTIERQVERARREGVHRHVEIRSGMRILDVGCGAGDFLRVAAGLGADVQGVEPSPIAIEAALGEGAPPIFHGTLDDFAAKFPDRRFDLITSNHVLEHVPDPVTTLATMRELLAEGGYVWVSVPNSGCPDSRSLRSYWHSSELPLHLHHYTLASLSAAGAWAGLRCATLATHSLPRGVAVSIRMRLRRRLLVPWQLTSRIGAIDTILAPRRARRLDAAMKGEAILATFVPWVGAGKSDEGGRAER